MKKVFGVILFLMFLYGVYIGVETYRIKSSNDLVKPLILVEAYSTPDQMSFKSIGFEVVYKIERVKKSYDLEVITTKESKFILFDIFTLWTKYYSEEWLILLIFTFKLCTMNLEVILMLMMKNLTCFTHVIFFRRN